MGKKVRFASRSTVQGWEERAAEIVAPGLLVHRALVGESLSERWAVTHEPSGYRVAGVPTKRAALELASSLAAVGDWTRDLLTLRGDAAFCTKVKEILGLPPEETRRPKPQSSV